MNSWQLPTDTPIWVALIAVLMFVGTWIGSMIADLCKPLTAVPPRKQREPRQRPGLTKYDAPGYPTIPPPRPQPPPPVDRQFINTLAAELIEKANQLNLGGTGNDQMGKLVDMIAELQRRNAAVERKLFAMSRLVTMLRAQIGETKAKAAPDDCTTPQPTSYERPSTYAAIWQEDERGHNDRCNTQ